jgi:hypothetical protein
VTARSHTRTTRKARRRERARRREHRARKRQRHHPQTSAHERPTFFRNTATPTDARCPFGAGTVASLIFPAIRFSRLFDLSVWKLS